MLVACNEITTLVSKLKFFLCLVLRFCFSENQPFCKIFDIKGFSVVRKGLALLGIEMFKT